MRIISGTCRGRRLCAPGKQNARAPIRPTADRVREALFSILGERPRGAQILDLYAGTGALGLEALSRGGEAAVFVDQGTEALGLIRRNIELCGFGNRATVLRHDLRHGLAILAGSRPAAGFDLIFLDPPYRRELAAALLEVLWKSGLLAPGGLVIAEEAKGIDLPATFPGLALADHRIYGDTGIWFYGAE